MRASVSSRVNVDIACSFHAAANLRTAYDRFQGFVGWAKAVRPCPPLQWWARYAMPTLLMTSGRRYRTFFSSGLADDGFVFLFHHAEFHQQILQFIHGDRGGDDEVLVVDDLVGQVAILLRLCRLRFVLDHGHAADFGALHHVVARHEVDHGGAHLARQFHDQLIFTGGVAAVADQAGQTHATGVGVLDDALGDVVGGIHGHHLAGTDDVDFLRLVLADGHGETAAHHVTEHVVEHEVEAFLVSAFLFQEVDGGNHAADSAPVARSRPIRLDAVA